MSKRRFFNNAERKIKISRCIRTYGVHQQSISGVGIYVNTAGKRWFIATMDVRLVKGSRRGKILVIDGFRYQRHKSSGALLHWWCWRETCLAKVKTNIFDVDNPHPRIRVVERNDHNHPDDSVMTDAISFRQQLQEEAAADPTRPPRRIYNTQVAQIHRSQGSGDRPQLPSYLSVRAFFFFFVVR